MLCACVIDQVTLRKRAPIAAEVFIGLLSSNAKRFTELSGGQLSFPQGNELDVPIAQDLLPALIGVATD